MQKITNTAPLINEEGKHLTRRFLGNLFPKNPIEVKELKAYVKGHSKFTHGRYTDGSPVMFTVRQEYFYQ